MQIYLDLRRFTVKWDKNTEEQHIFLHVKCVIYMYMKYMTGLTARIWCKSVSSCVYLTHRLSAELLVCGIWFIADRSFKGNNKRQVALKQRCRLPEIAQSFTSVCFSNLALCQTSPVCFSNLVLLFVMRWLLRDLYSLVSRCLRHTHTPRKHSYHAFMSLSLNLISHMRTSKIRFIWVKPDTVTHARQLRSLSN